VNETSVTDHLSRTQPGGRGRQQFRVSARTAACALRAQRLSGIARYR